MPFTTVPVEHAAYLPDDLVWDTYSSGHHCLREYVRNTNYTRKAQIFTGCANLWNMNLFLGHVMY